MIVLIIPLEMLSPGYAFTISFFQMCFPIKWMVSRQKPPWEYFPGLHNRRASLYFFRLKFHGVFPLCLFMQKFLKISLENNFQIFFVPSEINRIYSFSCAPRELFSSMGWKLRLILSKKLFTAFGCVCPLWQYHREPRFVCSYLKNNDPRLWFLFALLNKSTYVYSKALYALKKLCALIFAKKSVPSSIENVTSP